MPNCISTWPSPNFVTLQAQLFSHFCLKNFEKRVEWKALLSLSLPKRSRKCFLTFSPIHFYCQSVNPHIFQGHVRQDSGVCRLRLRQILLFRSTEYVSCFLLLKSDLKLAIQSNYLELKSASSLLCLPPWRKCKLWQHEIAAVRKESSQEKRFTF